MKTRKKWKKDFWGKEKEENIRKENEKHKIIKNQWRKKGKDERKLNTGEKECWKRETEKKINGNGGGGGAMNVQINYERRVRLTKR